MPLLFLWCHYFFKVLLHYNNVVILILLFNCWYYLRNRNHAVAVAISSKNDAEPKQNPKEKVFPVIVCFGHTKCTICPAYLHSFLFPIPKNYMFVHFVQNLANKQKSCTDRTRCAFCVTKKTPKLFYLPACLSLAVSPCLLDCCYEKT